MVGEFLRKIQEVNMQDKMLRSLIGKNSIDSNINRLEKLILILAEEIDKEKENIKI